MTGSRPTDAAQVAAAPTGPRLARRDFVRLAAFIEERYGIKLPPVKQALVESRLARRVHALGLPGFAAYADLVLGDPTGAERVELVNCITTNKTDFFREARHFELLAGEVLDRVRTDLGAGADRPLRVWSAGCSSGEEPYTLAMVLSEAAEASPGLSFRILATDLSTRVLRRASEGLYPDALVEPVPLALRRKYLQRSKADPALVRIRPALRRLVTFRQVNLLDRDHGIGEPQDVVFCRNVLIYFERRLQERVLRHLCDELAPGGFLFLGHSESTTGMDLPLDPVGPTVYRRRPLAGEGPRP
jgi:chemotaxis protein methyltransferase CheR